MARDQSLDVARGALMLYIVAVIHGVWWLNVFNGQRVGGYLLFEMPAIFAVSGYAYRLFEASAKDGGGVRTLKGYVRFCVTRLTRIIVPYFFYALLAIGVVLILKGRAGHGDWPASAVVFAWLDPLTAGGPFNLGSLSWHLWFIGPFLAVSALLPAASRLVPRAGLPLWAFTALLTAAMAGFARLSLPNQGFLQTVLFYLAWALFGYGLALRREDGLRDRLLTFGAAVVALALIARHSGGALNLQAEKFPPTWTFTLFSGAWMAVLLTGLAFVPKDRVNTLAAAPWFRPWVVSGYSIYLWQGAGYSLARLLGERFALPVVATWIVAVALTMALGVAASPLERIRVRR